MSRYAYRIPYFHRFFRLFYPSETNAEAIGLIREVRGELCGVVDELVRLERLFVSLPREGSINGRVMNAQQRDSLAMDLEQAADILTHVAEQLRRL